jgi:hypothetical protein
MEWARIHPANAPWTTRCIKIIIIIISELLKKLEAVVFMQFRLPRCTVKDFGADPQSEESYRV